jgi:hypothetical protein
VELVQQDVSGIGEAGYSPLLLEARDRIGGRVYPFSFQPNLIKENESQSISDDTAWSELDSLV